MILWRLVFRIVCHNWRVQASAAVEIFIGIVTDSVSRLYHLQDSRSVVRGFVHEWGGWTDKFRGQKILDILQSRVESIFVRGATCSFIVGASALDQHPDRRSKLRMSVHFGADDLV